MADLLFKTGEYDFNFCPSECEKGTDAEKEDCIVCIRRWLLEEENHE